MATEYDPLDQIGTRRPKAEQQKAFTESTSEVDLIGARDTYNPRFDTTDIPIVDNPVEAFMAGIQSGVKNITAQNINMNAAFKTFMGKDQEAQALLEKTDTFEYEASIPLMNMEQFDEFLEEPTFVGFMNQMTSATGQFLPSALATLVEAGSLALAGVGLTVATGGTAPAALIGTGSAASRLRKTPVSIEQIGGHSKTKDYLNNIIKKQYQISLDKAAKRRSSVKLTPRELSDLELHIYPALRAEKLARRGQTGALLGAFGQEFRQGSGIAFSDYADQGMTDKDAAMASFAQGSVFGAIGVGSEALVAKKIFDRLKKAPIHKRTLEDDIFKYDKPKSQMLKDFGSIAGITAFSEGIAEGLQEELSIQQKFTIDDAYTQGNANLDRAHAYFAGFFGGLGLGGGIGGATAVTNKARQFFNTAADNELARQEAERQARVVASGGVIQESASAIEDQFEFAFDTKSGKDTEWVELGSRTQFEKAQPNLYKKYGEDLIVVPSFGRGVLFTKNPLKAEQYRNFLKTDRANTEMHDKLLAKLLGYTRSRNPEKDGWVVYIRNTLTGNQVWYQQTSGSEELGNKTGIQLAEEQAYKILARANLGQKGKYEVGVQPIEEHVEERLNAIPEAEREVAYFDEDTKQPTTVKQNVSDPKDREAFMEMDDEAGLDGQSGVTEEAQEGTIDERADIDRQIDQGKDEEAIANTYLEEFYKLKLTVKDKDGNDKIDTFKELTKFTNLIEGINSIKRGVLNNITTRKKIPGKTVEKTVVEENREPYTDADYKKAQETLLAEAQSFLRGEARVIDAEAERLREKEDDPKDDSYIPPPKTRAEARDKTSRLREQAKENLFGKKLNKIRNRSIFGPIEGLTEKDRVELEKVKIKRPVTFKKIQVPAYELIKPEETKKTTKEVIKDLPKAQKAFLLTAFNEINKAIARLENELSFDSTTREFDPLVLLKELKKNPLSMGLFLDDLKKAISADRAAEISSSKDNIMVAMEGITDLTSDEAELTPKSTIIDKSNIPGAVKGDKLKPNNDPVIMERGGNGTMQNPFTDPKQLKGKDTTIENSAFYIRKGDEKASEELIQEARALVHVNFLAEFDAGRDKFSTNLLNRFIEKTLKKEAKEQKDIPSYSKLSEREKELEERTEALFKSLPDLKIIVDKAIKDNPNLREVKEYVRQTQADFIVPPQKGVTTPAVMSLEKFKGPRRQAALLLKLHNKGKLKQDEGDKEGVVTRTQDVGALYFNQVLKPETIKELEAIAQERQEIKNLLAERLATFNPTEFLRIVPLAELDSLRNSIEPVQRLNMERNPNYQENANFREEKFALVMHEVGNAQELIRQSKNSITDIEEYINDIIAYGIDAGKNRKVLTQMKFRIKSNYNIRKFPGTAGQDAEIGIMAAKMLGLMKYTQQRDNEIDQIGSKNFNQLRALGFVDLIDKLDEYGHALEYYPEGTLNMVTGKKKENDDFGPGITLTKTFIKNSKNAKSVEQIVKDLGELRNAIDPYDNSGPILRVEDELRRMFGDRAISLFTSNKRARARARLDLGGRPLKIISGGQTGADITFSKAAKEAGVETGGLMPEGFITLDGKKPKYAALYNMEEDTSEEGKSAVDPKAKYNIRTRKNVQNSDGTIIIVNDKNNMTPGSIATKRFAHKLRKPVLVVTPYEKNLKAKIKTFIKSNDIRTLNGAGSRKIQNQDTLKSILNSIFQEIQKDYSERDALRRNRKGVSTRSTSRKTWLGEGPITKDFVYGMMLEDHTSGIHNDVGADELSYTDLAKTFLSQDKVAKIENTIDKYIITQDTKEFIDTRPTTVLSPVEILTKEEIIAKFPGAVGAAWGGKPGELHPSIRRVDSLTLEEIQTYINTLAEGAPINFMPSSGIPGVRESLLAGGRPLSEVTKQDLLDWLKKNKINRMPSIEGKKGLPINDKRTMKQLLVAYEANKEWVKEETDIGPAYQYSNLKTGDSHIGRMPDQVINQLENEWLPSVMSSDDQAKKYLDTYPSSDFLLEEDINFTTDRENLFVPYYDLIDSHEKTIETAGRKVLWFGEVDYEYTGASHKAEPMSKIVEEEARKLEQQLGYPKGYFNSMLANLYPKGKGIAAHSDDEAIFVRENGTVGAVATVNIGGSSLVTIRNKKTKKQIGSRTMVKNGDVYVMPDGSFQVDTTHEVGPADKPRISLTFRHIPSQFASEYKEEFQNPDSVIPKEVFTGEAWHGDPVRWKGPWLRKGFDPYQGNQAKDQFYIRKGLFDYYQENLRNHQEYQDVTINQYVKRQIDKIIYPLHELQMIMDEATSMIARTDDETRETTRIEERGNEEGGTEEVKVFELVEIVKEEPVAVWIDDVLSIKDAYKDLDISEQGKAYATVFQNVIKSQPAGELDLDRAKGEQDLFEYMAENEAAVFRGRADKYSPDIQKPILRDSKGVPVLDKYGNVQRLGDVQKLNPEVEARIADKKFVESVKSYYGFVPPRKLEMPEKTIPKNPKPKTIVSPKMEEELNKVDNVPVSDDLLYAPEAAMSGVYIPGGKQVQTAPETQEEPFFEGLPDSETFNKMSSQEQDATMEAGYQDYQRSQAQEQPVQQQTPARQRANAKQEVKKQQAKDKTADALKQRQATSKQRQAGAKKRTKAQEKLRISDIDRIQQAARRLGLKRNVQIIHVDEEIGREAEGKFSLGSGGANAKLQNAIDDLKDRVAKGQKKYGRTIRFKNGDVIIIADNNAELKKGYYQTVMHELGESFVNQELDRSLKNSRVRNKLLEAFNKVKNKNPAYQKENGFYEWIADNFGSALRIELGLPQDLNTANLKKINKSANTWFKRLAKKLKEFYDSLPEVHKIRMEINDTAQEYIQNIALGIRFPITNAKLSYETKAKIEAELEYLMGPETYTEKQLRKIVLEARKLLRSNKLPNWLQYIFFTGDSRLRNLGPVGERIANFYYSPSRTKVETGLLLAKQAKAQQYISKIAEILDVTDNFNVLQPNFYSTLTEEQGAILTAAESDIATEDLQNPKAVELRNLLKEMYKELGLKELGVKERANFFPRVIAIYELAGNPKLREDLINLLDRKNPQVPREEVVNAVDKLIKKGQGHIDFGKESNDPLEVGVLFRYKPLFENVTRTELRDINAIEAPEVALKKYIDKAVVRHEFEKRGGVKYLRNLMDKLTPEEQVIAQEIQDGIMGRVSPVQNGMLRWANNIGLVLNIITLLAFTVLASLPDLAGPILRSRSADVRPVFDTIKYMIKNPQEARELSKEIGVIGIDAMSTFFINAGEVDFLSQTGQKVSNTFFRVTGLEMFTRFTRVFATGMGKQFLINHAKKAKAGNLTSQSYLEELQVTADEVLLWEQGKASPEVRAKVNEGLARFVDESIVRPNSAERPTWANDPRYALIWQLKSFYYAYWKNIVGGTLRDAKGNAKNGSISTAAMPLVFMALMLLPLTILGWEIREWTKASLAWLLPGVSPNDPGVDYYRTDSMTNGQYYTELFDRTGALGPGSMALPLFLESHRHGKPFWISPLGPSAERIWDARPWNFEMKPADFIPIYSQLDTRAFGDAARQ